MKRSHSEALPNAKHARLELNTIKQRLERVRRKESLKKNPVAYLRARELGGSMKRPEFPFKHMLNIESKTFIEDFFKFVKEKLQFKNKDRILKLGEFIPEPVHIEVRLEEGMGDYFHDYSVVGEYVLTIVMFTKEEQNDSRSNHSGSNDGFICKIQMNSKQGICGFVQEFGYLDVVLKDPINGRPALKEFNTSKPLPALMRHFKPFVIYEINEMIHAIQRELILSEIRNTPRH